MLKVPLFIGLLLALVLALIVLIMWAEQQRPGRERRDRKLRRAALLIGPVAVVLLVLWAGLTLFTGGSGPEGPNVVKRTVPGEGAGAGLVAHAPLSKTALRCSPVASALTGVGSRLVPGSSAAEPAAPARPAEPAPPEAPPGPTELLFTVHLASFQALANAERNVQTLKARGVPAFLRRVELEDGRVFHRLMAGRFSSRAEALAYGRELEKKGLPPGLGPARVKPLVSSPAGE